MNINEFVEELHLELVLMFGQQLSFNTWVCCSESSNILHLANQEHAKRWLHRKGADTGARYSKLKQEVEWRLHHKGIDIAGKPLIKKQANSSRSQQRHKMVGKQPT
jgi:hypothetical protein